VGNCHDNDTKLQAHNKPWQASHSDFPPSPADDNVGDHVKSAMIIRKNVENVSKAKIIRQAAWQELQ
jgi:hypothetical protein